jgi:mannose/fructose/N-acetylgalactosamine-specific phosphotransferase system component IIB
VVNKTLQSIMMMGIPAMYKKAMVSSEDARKILSEKADHNRLFVTRFPQDLTKFTEELKTLETVYIGNAAKTPISKYSFSREGGSVFYASDEDIKLFDALSKQGVNLIVQTVPNAPARTWIEAQNTLRPI